MGDSNDNFERIEDEISDGLLDSDLLASDPADTTDKEDYNNENGLDYEANNEDRQNEWEWGAGALVVTLLVIALATACETLFSWANRRQINRKRDKSIKDSYDYDATEAV